MFLVVSYDLGCEECVRRLLDPLRLYVKPSLCRFNIEFANVVIG